LAVSKLEHIRIGASVAGGTLGAAEAVVRNGLGTAALRGCRTVIGEGMAVLGPQGGSTARGNLRYHVLPRGVCSPGYWWGGCSATEAAARDRLNQENAGLMPIDRILRVISL